MHSSGETGAMILCTEICCSRSGGGRGEVLRQVLVRCRVSLLAMRRQGASPPHLPHTEGTCSKALNTKAAGLFKKHTTQKRSLSAKKAMWQMTLLKDGKGLVYSKLLFKGKKMWFEDIFLPSFSLSLLNEIEMQFYIFKEQCPFCQEIY